MSVMKYSIGLTLAVATGVLSAALFNPRILAQSGELLPVGNFSAAGVGGNLPSGWEPLTFRSIRNHTQYSLVQDGGTVVVKATSSNSASGMIRRMAIAPQEYPRLQWRWKVSNMLNKSDVTRKAGDDYPARIYVAFGEGEPPRRVLNYIWANQAAIDTSVPSPYTDRVQLIVVESGAGNVNRWVMEQRNVYEDYRNAFGEEPPPISGVGIMTDTDNTGDAATAYYGDIVFQKP